MKKIIAYTLLGLYLHAAFAAYMPVINYVVNYDFYKNVLCENKAKPELQCNGKCHLAKEINISKEQSTDSKLPIPSIDFSKRSISTIEQITVYNFCALCSKNPNVLDLGFTETNKVYLSIIVPPPIDIA